jgi:hypothetical protein
METSTLLLSMLKMGRLPPFSASSPDGSALKQGLSVQA